MGLDDLKDLYIKEFSFISPENFNQKCSFKVNVGIPILENVEEFCERIIEENKLPLSLRRVAVRALQNFIESENDKYFDKSSESVLSTFIQGKYSTEDVLKLWKRVFNKNTMKYGYGSEITLSDDDELFSTVYHKLVHSPALETILQVEHSYSLETEKIINERDTNLAELSLKQTEEMGKAMEGLSLGLTEADITAIASRHLEEHGIEIASWQSKLAGLRDTQRATYRDWLMSLLEQSYDSTIPMAPSGFLMGFRDQHSEENEAQQSVLFQESFTIHLGSQMKQMYNIRIISAYVLDLCKVRSLQTGDLELQPQRLQTSLSLYSSDLSGLVLLSDNHLGGFSGTTKDFIKICEMSTELHFKSIDEQIDEIRESVKEGIRRRRCSTSETSSLTSTEQQSRKSSTKYLQPGDVFITKHSNLSEVHVVFHVVVDDTVKSNDITSRHSVILGIRNTMKCACSYDITTLTIPVLLTHEIFESMTTAWCLKRAELVYKCIKGFMIEMASWGGSELKNLQFLVPEGISEETFSSLANMIPSIFRLSNPLVLKASSSKVIK